VHVHHLQAEGLTVLEGRIGYQTLGGEERFAGPGETVSFAPGVPHKFWNAGDTTMRCRGWISPVHNVEFFLTSLYASARENGGRPHLLDAAWLLTRYRSEFGMLEIPALVQRFVFPVQLLIGRLTGRYARFASAPEPAAE
jgi:hypothetical protein